MNNTYHLGEILLLVCLQLINSFPSLCLEDQIPICFKIKLKNTAKVAANRSLIFSVYNDVVNFRGNRQWFCSTYCMYTMNSAGYWLSSCRKAMWTCKFFVNSSEVVLRKTEIFWQMENFNSLLDDGEHVIKLS